MSSPGYRRHALLFFIAIILPCSGLIALGVRLIAQQEELAQKRLADERALVARDLRQELLTRLERIQLQEVSGSSESGAARRGSENSPVVLVGRVESDRLVMPWDTTHSLKEARRLLAEPGWARKVQQAEQFEFAQKDLSRAVATYREALAGSRHPIQSGQARLLLARALSRRGQKEDALAQYRTILALPTEVIDEHGMPLFLYAARGLLEGGDDAMHVLERVRAAVDDLTRVPPAATYALLDLGESLVESVDERADLQRATDLLGRLSLHRDFLEQALALQGDLPKLGLQPARPGREPDEEPIWALYGSPRWFVGLASPLEGSSPTLVAVRAQEVLVELEATLASSLDTVGAVRLLTDTSTAGEPLGLSFPGLRVLFEVADGDQPGRWNQQSIFYVLILLLVVSTTLFGAYLVWRDIRRELRLAEMRSQFVSSVSHELKTPLTAIRMFAETLRSGRMKDEQRKAEYLETITNESERLTRLLNNVLDFAKIEEGKKMYRLRPASLDEAVRTAARAMQYPLAQRGFNLRVDSVDTSARASVDSDALQQAVLNLLANAMKYSPDGGDIDLRLTRQNGQAVIQVVDKGVGIAPEDQRRIFDKFYRVATAENEHVPGTGLGLTLVQHMAKGHGGHVEVESRVGEGSTFSIHLPLVGDEE